jgi:hypothetical protein
MGTGAGHAGAYSCAVDRDDAGANPPGRLPAAAEAIMISNAFISILVLLLSAAISLTALNVLEWA